MLDQRLADFQRDPTSGVPAGELKHAVLPADQEPMIHRIIVCPLAVEDLVEAAAWYETQAEGLGEELIDEMLRALHRAAASPELSRILRRDGDQSSQAQARSQSEAPACATIDLARDAVFAVHSV